VLVRFLEAVSVIADPRPKALLDARYNVYRHRASTQARPRSHESIEASIAAMKKADRYGEPMLGFPRTRTFKPGNLVAIPDEIAEKWQRCGYCEPLETASSMAARGR
jgi:hypothetical protein